MNRIEHFREAALAAGQELWREANERTADARTELNRRTTLARQPQPEGVRPPSMRMLLGELQAVRPGRRAVRQMTITPARQPQPVMLLPGFGSHPIRMKALERALGKAGHSAEDWGLGFNFGPSVENFDFLCDRVRRMAAEHRGPVSLVGWSLGGLFAREIAHREAASVRMVITLGSPFSGDLHANNAWRAYQLVTGHPVDQPPVHCDFAAKPPVPTVALWSPRDGVVAPRSACGWPGERDRAVALRCNHIGFAKDPGAIAEVLRQLDWDAESASVSCESDANLITPNG